MKTLVLVFHQDFTTSRANKCLAEEIKQQAHVTVHHVYGAYPDENIDIATEQRLMEGHDRIILKFSFYWYSTPSLLKKWEDDVLATD